MWPFNRKKPAKAAPPLLLTTSSKDYIKGDYGNRRYTPLASVKRDLSGTTSTRPIREDDWSTDPINPLNPFSPFNPMNQVPDTPAPSDTFSGGGGDFGGGGSSGSWGDSSSSDSSSSYDSGSSSCDSGSSSGGDW